jgi:sorbitol-specific phosphotransferase system component IIC
MFWSDWDIFVWIGVLVTVLNFSLIFLNLAMGSYWFILMNLFAVWLSGSSTRSYYIRMRNNAQVAEPDPNTGGW